MATPDQEIAAEIATAPASAEHRSAPSIDSALGRETALSDLQNAPVDTTGLQDRLASAPQAATGPLEPVLLATPLLDRVRKLVGEGGDVADFVRRAVAEALQRQGG